MKTRTILALTLVLSFVLGGVVMAEDDPPERYDYQPDMCRDAGQHPDDPALDDCIITGDAFYECNQLLDEYEEPLGYTWAKRVSYFSNTWPVVDHGVFIQDVTVDTDDYADGFTFDWWVSDHPLGSVLVKSVGKGMQSGGYHIYTYPNEDAMSDEGLTGVTMEKVKGKDGDADPYEFDINHITFCWNAKDDNGDEICVGDETAWAAGEDFPSANWAMYVPYDADAAPFTVDLLAGRDDMVAGDVTFSAPDADGWVEITIQLTGDWVFYYDVDDNELDNNVKVMGYTEEPDETTSTAPGLFDFKEYADLALSFHTITVPYYDEESGDPYLFYAVHVDVAHPVECEE